MMVLTGKGGNEKEALGRGNKGERKKKGNV